MYEVSWHTHQINLWIALTKFQPTFSASLEQLGYETDVIEDHLYLHNEEGEDVIHPDVVLTSEEDEHSLIVDCKSEKVKQDQIRRYLRMDGNEDQLVIQGLVSGVDPPISAETALSSFSDLTSEDIPGEIALVHFDVDPTSGIAIWNLDGHEFDNSAVEDVFPINAQPSEPLPTSHYPFDIYEGDKEAMVAGVFSAVVSLAMKQGEYSIEDILDCAHPYWDKLGDQKQEALLERTEIIHLELRDAGLDQYLERIAGTQGRERRRTSATIQAIHRETEYYVEQVLEDLPQARLDHQEWAADSSNTDGESGTVDD
jgi:hypothetical protein